MKLEDMPALIDFLPIKPTRWVVLFWVAVVVVGAAVYFFAQSKVAQYH
jgi:hypothetical protein